jgi:uncharacterized membrane protein YqjE
VAVAIHREEPSFTDRLRNGRGEFQQLRNDAGDIAGGVGRVARDEVKLAVSEVRDGVKATVKTSIWGSLALGFAAVTLMWLPLPIAVGLAEVMPWWAAALLTVAILAAVTAVLGSIAYSQFKRISFVPREAMGRMKEDKEWLKQQLSRNQS